PSARTPTASQRVLPLTRPHLPFRLWSAAAAYEKYFFVSPPVFPAVPAFLPSNLPTFRLSPPPFPPRRGPAGRTEHRMTWRSPERPPILTKEESCLEQRNRQFLPDALLPGQ